MIWDRTSEEGAKTSEEKFEEERKKDMWVFQGWSACTRSGKGTLPSCIAYELGWSSGQNELRKKKTCGSFSIDLPASVKCKPGCHHALHDC